LLWYAIVRIFQVSNPIPKGVDRMDTMHESIEFRPRGRTLAMGGIPWLPRITDKARAMLRNNIGDYVYP
jgi:hypothetical protein